MIFIDIEMPSRCADCPCFKITRSDGERYGSDGCQLMHLRFNEDVYYGKHIHNPFKSRHEDCPLRDANDFSKTIADRPRGEWADMNGNPVPLNEDGETTNSCWCSECGEWLVASDEYPTRGNFCPNCGADMRSE